MDASIYKVRLEIFEGPLDLLLFLIKKAEIDVHDVVIETIADQYLTYIDAFKMLNIDLASEFLVMAANLMYIKSRTLLPRSQQAADVDAEEDDPRWDLIRQLIEYKKFKDAAGFLAKRENQFSGRFPNAAAGHINKEAASLAETSIFDLVGALQNVLKRFANAKELTSIVDDRFTVADKIERLLTLVRPNHSMKFSALFASATTKAEVIVTFLALLELMKLNQFIATQTTINDEIVISRREEAQAITPN